MMADVLDAAKWREPGAPFGWLKPHALQVLPRRTLRDTWAIGFERMCAYDR